MDNENDSSNNKTWTIENKVPIRTTGRVLQLLSQFSTKSEEEILLTKMTTKDEFEDLAKPESTLHDSESFDKIVFNIVYRKKTMKKHKTWDGDGILEFNEKIAILKDLDGRVMGRTKVNCDTLFEGSLISVGNLEVEIIKRVKQNDSDEKSDEKIIEKKRALETTKASCSQPIVKKFKPISKLFTPLTSGLKKGSNKKYDPLVMLDANDETDFLLHGNNKQNKVDVCVDTHTISTLRPYQTSNEALPKPDSTMHDESCGKIIFNILYRKKTMKKHKTWDGDGILEVIEKSATLKNLDGRVIGRTKVNRDTLLEGSVICAGNLEVEIIERVEQNENDSKRCTEIIQNKRDLETEVARPPYTKPIAKTLKPISKQFTPLISGLKKGLNQKYDPLVMPHINDETNFWLDENKQIEVDVSLDPCIVSALRPHQRFGVVFLYKCIMGMSVKDHYGAILADEMGLGKTLQCISVIWTLLKKGPYGKPVLKRVLIITPSSLCNNWNKEFNHWLGLHRISPFVVNSKNKPKDFTKRVKDSVMIISYEMFVRCFEDINHIDFDLIICDEGHRLKNKDIQAVKLLSEINCKRRILITGTPIQNDLQEFYALVDFVNPGILNDPHEFKNHYETPIVESKCPNVPETVKTLGEERAMELRERTNLFILRRTQDIIHKYLPRKQEVVVLCRLSKEQEYLYTQITDAWFHKEMISERSIPHLSIITALKKICNHPSLILNEPDGIINNFLPHLKQTKHSTPTKNTLLSNYSGKASILCSLIENIKTSDEKLVLVSYYTKTLDFFENICRTENLKYLRLDGQTPSTIRTKVVEQFNNIRSDDKIFLLSAKAGGVGLNLIGGSRLVLFDSDWNPALDAQAMARIWREGQKKDVYIYRFLTAGTIEEKIYQRQISKAGLSETVMDSNDFTSVKFSSDELKDLFTLIKDVDSITHQSIGCTCDGDKNNQTPKISKESQFILENQCDSSHLTINQLFHWEHYKQPVPIRIMEELMLNQVTDDVTFIFKNSYLQ